MQKDQKRGMVTSKTIEETIQRGRGRPINNIYSSRKSAHLNKKMHITRSF